MKSAESAQTASEPAQNEDQAISSVAKRDGATTTSGGEMADPEYKYNVTMTCSGCSGAVERALKRVDGIDTTVDLPSQLVTVRDPGGKVGHETILSKIQKTGKKVNSYDSGDGKGWQDVAAAA